MWTIYDRKEGCYVGKPYGNRRRAQSRAERLDLIYGAYRYNVRALTKPETSEASYVD